MSWDEYYKSRVNNDEYLRGFSIKYSTSISFLLDSISISEYSTIKEEGCGIGNLSKSLESYFADDYFAPKLIMSDNNRKQLELCEQNLQSISYLDPYMILEDITEDHKVEDKTVVMTHGVLEHLSDNDILKVLIRHKNDDNIIAGIHYVPLYGYGSPSFGDERLLTQEFWMTKISQAGFEKATYINVDNKDLFFMIK